MGLHLYVCDTGGPMTLAIDGSPPRWATCPVCVKSVECERCRGAQLQGEAPHVATGPMLVYRCPAGHTRAIATPVGVDRPESAQCPECDGMLVPEAALAS